jgi:hypothetical protein
MRVATGLLYGARPGAHDLYKEEGAARMCAAIRAPQRDAGPTPQDQAGRLHL